MFQSVLKLLIYCISLVIAFIFGKIINVPGVTLDTELNPFHALSPLVTLVIALVLSIYVQRSRDINGSASDLTIKRVDKIIDLLDDLQESVSATNRILTTNANAFPKRIGSGLKSTLSSLHENNIPVSVEYSELEIIIRDLREVLTLTPVQNDENKGKDKPIYVENGYTHYNSSKVSEVNKLVDDLRDMLFKIQLDINNSYGKKYP